MQRPSQVGSAPNPTSHQQQEQQQAESALWKPFQDIQNTRAVSGKAESYESRNSQ